MKRFKFEKNIYILIIKTDNSYKLISVTRKRVSVIFISHVTTEEFHQPNPITAS